MTSFADRLKLAIETSGVGSQRQLALKAKLRPATITRWVQGETKTIRPIDLEAAAKVLGVSAKWLGTGVGPMLPAMSPDEGVKAITDAAAESPKPYRTDPPQGLNTDLLREVVKAVLEECSDWDSDSIATQVAAAYEFIQRTGKLSKVREVVRMGLS